MKKINWNFIIFTCLICLMPICLGLFFYEELPEVMPIHFNIHEQPDNWASKNFTIFGIPIIMAALQMFCCIVSDMAEGKKEKDSKVIKIMKWFIPSATILLYTITILIGLGKKVDVGKCVTLFLGIMFVMMGNYMPKMSYEEAKGNLKTMPKNEKDYKQMVRLFGYTFVVGGIFMMAAIFISNMAAFIMVLGVCVLVFVEGIYFSFK